MKKLILIVLLSIIYFANYAQTENQGNNWQPYLDNETIQVLYKTIQCSLPEEGINKEMVCLKFVNKTNQELKLEWDMQLFYNGN